jgi:outer membrane protein OmpA-like peptidoglycan-associated protein
MLKRHAISVFIWLLVPVLGFGQVSGREEPAERLIREGKKDAAYAMITSQLRDKPGHPGPLELLGRWYLAFHQYRLSVLFLNLALEKSEKPAPSLLMALGEACQRSHQFEEALAAYGEIPPKWGDRKVLMARVQECKTGLALKENPLEVRIANLGPRINTAGDEYRPLVSADFMQLFFTRNEIGGDPQVWHAQNRGGWEEVRTLPVEPNSRTTCAGVTSDARLVFLQVPDRKGDLFYSELGDGTWSRPQPFAYNSPAEESSVAFSADGKTLFFVSARSGNKDIYQCRKQSSGWSKPERLSSRINTPEDEESPWLDADGKYLYFSSRGHAGMGGYDIFRIAWKTPGAQVENLGYPINSSSDDRNYMLMPDEKTAFCNSSRDGGFGGEDLYSIRMQIGRSPQLALFKGSVSEPTGFPLECQVVVTDLESNQVVARLKSHPETGTFVTMLQTGKRYSVLIEREGYLFYSDLVDLLDGQPAGNLNRDIKMQQLLPGVTLQLSNLFFDPGKSSLRKESGQELLRILRIMRQNPGLRAEIAGHLDAGGPEDVLQKLSENRAQAVVDYLVATGIKATRLVAKGYGSSRPLTVGGNREQNRRIEFRILNL